MTKIEDAVLRAAGPQPLWALVPPVARARYLRRSAQAILDEVDALADLLAAGAGVPRTEALLAELLPSVGGLHGLAADGPRTVGPRRIGRIPALRAGRSSTIFNAPLGVVAIRAGLGSPWAEPALEVGAALLAGNGVVLVPSVPAAGDRLVAAIERAGVPDGLVQIAPTGARPSALEAACARLVDTEPPSPKTTMVVLDGAPLDRVVSGALWAAFARSGRGPRALGRIVVVQSMADPLLRRLEAAARRLRVGDPRLPDTEVGPLASAADLGLVEEVVEEAVAAGATLVCGGRLTGDGPFFAPAVLRSVPPGARLLREPVPGPVVAVLEARDEADAIALAGDEQRAVSVWAADRALGERVVRVLGAEVAWVNEHGSAASAAPVRLARYGEPRIVASQPSGLRSARWLPHDPALVRASETAARLMHGRESERLTVLRQGAPALAKVAVRLARGALR